MNRKSLCFVMAAMILLPTVNCVDLAVKTNVGSFTERLGAGMDDSIYASSVITREKLNNAVWGDIGPTKSNSNDYGNLNLAESHSVGNTAGAHAEVGVAITNAKSYDYRYALSQGTDVTNIVQAAESLNVNSAMAVNAYARAYNSARYDVGVRTTVNNGDLLGYSNLAIASADATGAFQSFDTATGAIQCDSTARTLTSAYSPLVEQRTNPEASIKTKGTGTIANYEDAAVKTSSSGTSLEQNARVVGKFTSASTAKTTSLTRMSDYGTKYDIDMQANIASNNVPSVKGTLTYYIDPSLKIQGAVDKSRIGDTISLAAGTYTENVVTIPNAVTVRGNNVVVTNGVTNTGGKVYLNAMEVFIRCDDLHMMNWQVDPQWTWLIGLANSKDFKATIAVVPQDAGASPGGSAVIPLLQPLDKNRFEVADHGYIHEDFPGLGTYNAQYNALKSGTDLLTEYVYRPRTFVCPMLDANADTVTAAKALGYHTIVEDAVNGLQGITQFKNDFEWESAWPNTGPIPWHTEAEFETAFNTKYNAGANTFEISMHPGDSTDGNKQAIFATSIDFMKGIQNTPHTRPNIYGSGVEFMTFEQYNRYNS